MRPVHRAYTVLSLLLATCFAGTTTAQTVKIMPVGDSITQGRLASAPIYEDVASYRYFLWHKLVTSGRCVDFVGSRTTPGSPNKPWYDSFDGDHEAVWSDKAENIAARIQAAVVAATPDIILVHAGSSDLSNGQTVASTLTDLENIIDNARLGKADVTILLAELIPFGPGPFFADVTPLNDLLPAMVASKTTVTSPVILVDHHTGWVPAIHSSFDQVHPFQLGELRMADTWFTELAGLIPTCGPAGPVADFSGTPLSGTSPLNVSFSDLSTGGATTWLWEFGDGATSTDQNPSHIYSASGTYTVNLTAGSTVGLGHEIKNAYVSVSGGIPAPSAEFTGTPTSGAAPLNVAFTDQSTGSPTSWAWTFGDGGTSTLQDPSHIYASSGTYTVTLTATNAGGSDVRTRTNYISVSGGVGPIKIMPVGDSITYARKNPPISYTNIASYRYFLWHMLRTSGRCVDFVGSQTTINAPGKPHYDNFDKDHEAKWFDKAEDIAARIQAAVTAAQPDIILLHAGSSDLSGGADVPSTITDIENIIDNARAGRADVQILVAQLIPFGAGPFFADVTGFNAALPALVASKTTATSPVTIVDHFTGYDPVVHSSFDNVHPFEIGELRMATTWHTTLAGLIPVCGPTGPTAAFTASPTIGPASLSVSFTDQSTSATTWLWEFGDGTTSTLQNPTHIYGTPGTYAVNLTAGDASGYLATEIKAGYITVGSGVPPVADFVGSPLSGLKPHNVTFTDQSTGADSWLWDFGDGGTSDQQNPSHLYTIPGTYTVSLTATNLVGSDVETKTNYVTVTGPAVYKIMPVGDSITSPRRSPPAKYANVASYRYFLWHQLVASGRCVDFVGSQTTTVAPVKTHYNNFDIQHEGIWSDKADGMAARIQATVTAEQPDIILLHAGSADLSAGETVASTITDIEAIIDNARAGRADVTIFLAQVIPFGPGPFFTDVVPLNNALPALAASKTTAISPVILVDHFTGWDPAVHSSLDNIHPYEIGELRMANTWFTEMAGLIPVCGPTGAVADFSAVPTVGGAPQSVVFTDLSTGSPSTWLWEFGDGTTSTLQNPTHVYTTNGTFAVNLTATNANGSGIEIKNDFITLTPGGGTPPTAEFIGLPLSGDAPLNVAFTDQSTGFPAIWSWTFGDGGTSEDQNPGHVYNAPGTYTVTLTASNGAGTDVKTRIDYITVEPPLPPVADFSGTPTTGDAPLSVAFTDSSTEFPATWLWDFGDGGTSALQNPTHIYTTPGTYTVMLTATNSKGSNAKTRTDYVTVSPALAPVADFVGTPTTGDAPLSVAFTDSSTEFPATWLWDFGDGGTSALQNPTHIYTTPGTYTVMLTATNSKGSNAKTRTDYITVSPALQPVADFTGTPTTGDAPLSVAFTDSSTEFPTSWLWDFGDGGTSALQSPSHIYTTPGTYTVMLTATNSKGSNAKTRTDYVTVSPALQPVADFTGTPTTGDAPLTVAFTDQSTEFPDAWLWDFGDGGTSDVQNPSHIYATPGTYTVKLTATNTKGSNANTRTDYVTVSAGLQPVADFTGTPTTGDAPLTVAFTDLSTEFPDTWLWDFGDGGTSASQSPSHIYTAPGTYTVKLTATNAKGSNAKTRTDYVTVSPALQPVADFTGTPTTGDAPLTVAFTDLSTEFPETWLWDFGDGGTSASQSPSHIYTAPGTYTVKLTATNSKGSNAKTRTDYVTVSPTLQPVADFTGTPTSGDAPLTVAFTDLSTEFPDTWLWDFGDGGTSASQSPSHIYAAPGTYTVKLTATNTKGSDTKTRTDYVTVSPAVQPVADFTGTPTSGDAPLTVAFTDLSTEFPDTWLWDFGDGGTSASQSPSHIYAAPGTYTVKLTATNSKGSNAKTRTDYVTVSPALQPVADFTGTPTTGDAPLTVAFTDLSTEFPDTWSWDFGDGGTSASQSPTHIYTVPGTYTVKLTATNSKGSDTKTRTDYVTVNPTVAPTAEFVGSPTSGEAPLSVAFTDQSTGTPTSWSWDFGDGGTSATQSPSHVYTAPGTYTVKLTATNSKGSDTKTRTDYVTVNPAGSPAAEFTGTPTSGDAPLSVSFTDQTTNFPIAWSWDFGDGGTSAVQNPSRVYTTPGTYSVQLIATNSLGSDTRTRIDYIEVVSPVKPTADFDGTPTSGEGPLSVSFNDLSTDFPTSWSWEFGDGGTSATQNPVHVYNLPGTYTVKLTATNSKGSDTKTRTDYVTVAPGTPPTADFSGTPTSGDAPLAVTFTDLSTNFPASWQWDFGDGGSSSAQNPSRVYATPGVYTVTLTATNSKGSDVKTRTNYIVVNASSKLRIMPLGDNITEARHGYATYRYFLWNQLKTNIDCADFVGSMRGTQGRFGIGHDGVPKYPNFDQDHEGHWGWRADEIADNAFNFATASQPDTVLCHIGTNDLYQNETAASTIVDIERIIDELRRANPRITIFLAQIIPFGPPFSVDVVPLNNLIPGLVAAKTTAQSPVILVDHFTGWNPAIHSIDGVHPNETGEQRMANTWYQAMVAQGLFCPAGFSRFGTGCAGSLGVPTLDAAPGQRPLIGGTFTLEAGALVPDTPVIGIIGFDNTVWNGVPLPMDLAGLGMPGCSLFVAYEHTIALTATSAGTLNWVLQVPNFPTLNGIHAYFQIAAGDPGQNALGVTVSNAGDGLIGSK